MHIILAIQIYISNKYCSSDFFGNQIILKKAIKVSTEILSSTAVFNINNSNKCFLSIKSSYYYDF